MEKVFSIVVIKIVSMIIIFMSTGIKACAQSPYAIFGDKSEVLDARKVDVPNFYRIKVQKPDGNSLYIEFNIKNSVVIFFDAEGNIIRQDSLSNNAKALFTTLDPHAENYNNLNPYNYCGGNPVNAIDPDGKDWYKNNDTSYYTWFDGSEEKEGYTRIGGKGSVLGEEFENILNTILCGKKGLGLESLYSDGFTFDIAPIDKGGLIGSEERGESLFKEFVCGTGPEFTVLLEDHPYTQAVMEDEHAIKFQKEVRSRGSNGSYTNVGRPSFRPWHADLLSPMQYIGTYRYDGYSSKDGLTIYNVATDPKSVESLFYHIPFISEYRRSQQTKLGNTYQFYLWKSKK